MSQDILDRYFDRLNDLEPLSADEQFELARRYRNGDPSAGQTLIETNLRLVVMLARKLNRPSVDFEDLIQAGNMGICEALKRFDPDVGVKFTSYASYWIRAKIRQQLSISHGQMRVDKTRAGRLIMNKLGKVREELYANGIRPTPLAIAKALDKTTDDIEITAEEVRKVIAALETKTTIRLDDTHYDKGEEKVIDYMPDEGPTPDVVAIHEDMRAKMREMIYAFADTLGERSTAIWWERTVAAEPKTLREISDDWGVTKERIRQIENGLKEAFAEFKADGQTIAELVEGEDEEMVA